MIKKSFLVFLFIIIAFSQGFAEEFRFDDKIITRRGETNTFEVYQKISTLNLPKGVNLDTLDIVNVAVGKFDREIVITEDVKLISFFPLTRRKLKEVQYLISYDKKGFFTIDKKSEKIYEKTDIFSLLFFIIFLFTLIFFSKIIIEKEELFRGIEKKYFLLSLFFLLSFLFLIFFNIAGNWLYFIFAFIILILNLLGVKECGLLFSLYLLLYTLCAKAFSVTPMDKVVFTIFLLISYAIPYAIIIVAEKREAEILKKPKPKDYVFLNED